MLTVYYQTCGLRYEPTAYRHHLEQPCEYGIHPMLACTDHGAECPYNNPVWRRELGADWNDKERKCRPLYSVKSAHTWRFDDSLERFTYLTLYEPDRPPKPSAPRLPGKERQDAA